MTQDLERTGGCLCGAVRYRLTGPVRPPVACFCSQCRRISGNFVVAIAVRAANLVVDGSDRITWYRSSPDAQRGFCVKCGASLFWQRAGAETTSIMAGTLDDASGLPVALQIFTAERGPFHADYPGVASAPGTAAIPTIEPEY